MTNPAAIYMPEYMDDSDESCPKCGHSPIRWKYCDVIGCDDGYIDLYEEDPLWYDIDDTEMCSECRGTGTQRWCPSCGADLSGMYQEDGVGEE